MCAERAAEAGERGDYPFGVVLATRWMDNDVYGHVNNVVYYAFFDTVINRYLIEHGGLEPGSSPVVGLAVESHCTFYQPVAYPQPVEARLRVGHVGRTSVRYEVGIFADGLERACAAGYFVHVFVDRVTRRPVPIPASVRTPLEALHTSRSV